jgi:hypothetical protein
MRLSIWCCAGSNVARRAELQVYPYLPQATVAITFAKSYLSLRAGGAS